MATETIPADRQQVALDASIRLEALLRMLRRECDADEDSNALELVLDDTLKRASDLAGVISLALIVGDDTSTTDLRRTVYGNCTDKGEVAHG